MTCLEIAHATCREVTPCREVQHVTRRQVTHVTRDVKHVTRREVTHVTRDVKHLTCREVTHVTCLDVMACLLQSRCGARGRHGCAPNSARFREKDARKGVHVSTCMFAHKYRVVLNFVLVVLLKMLSRWSFHS